MKEITQPNMEPSPSEGLIDAGDTNLGVIGEQVEEAEARSGCLSDILWRGGEGERLVPCFVLGNIVWTVPPRAIKNYTDDLKGKSRSSKINEEGTDAGTRCQDSPAPVIDHLCVKSVPNAVKMVKKNIKANDTRKTKCKTQISVTQFEFSPQQYEVALHPSKTNRPSFQIFSLQTCVSGGCGDFTAEYAFRVLSLSDLGPADLHYTTWPNLQRSVSHTSFLEEFWPICFISTSAEKADNISEPNIQYTRMKYLGSEEPAEDLSGLASPFRISVLLKVELIYLVSSTNAKYCSLAGCSSWNSTVHQKRREMGSNFQNKYCNGTYHHSETSPRSHVRYSFNFTLSGLSNTVKFLICLNERELLTDNKKRSTHRSRLNEVEKAQHSLNECLRDVLDRNIHHCQFGYSCWLKINHSTAEQFSSQRLQLKPVSCQESGLADWLPRLDLEKSANAVYGSPQVILLNDCSYLIQPWHRVLSLHVPLKVLYGKRMMTRDTERIFLTCLLARRSHGSLQARQEVYNAPVSFYSETCIRLYVIYPRSFDLSAFTEFPNNLITILLLFIASQDIIILDLLFAVFVFTSCGEYKGVTTQFPVTTLPNEMALGQMWATLQATSPPRPSSLYLGAALTVIKHYRVKARADPTFSVINLPEGQM
ncbi:hypothetical protein L345_02882, partial [Ophiophagus hannah]